MAGRSGGSGIVAGASRGRGRGSGTVCAAASAPSASSAAVSSAARRPWSEEGSVKAVASVRAGPYRMQANPSNFEGAMPIRAILFDKDGTLVDIQLTLGPATCDVLWRLSNGDQAMVARLAELTRVDAAARRLMPGCPVISEATDVYGRTWAQALGRGYTPEFGREIDRLVPRNDAGASSADRRSACRAGGFARGRLPPRHHDQRCGGQHAGTDAAPRHRRAGRIRRRLRLRASGRNPMPRPCWRSPRRWG